jgi:hypothetical protein
VSTWKRASKYREDCATKNIFLSGELFLPKSLSKDAFLKFKRRAVKHSVARFFWVAVATQDFRSPREFATSGDNFTVRMLLLVFYATHKNRMFVLYVFAAPEKTTLDSVLQLPQNLENLSCSIL